MIENEPAQANLIEDCLRSEIEQVVQIILSQPDSNESIETEPLLSEYVSGFTSLSSEQLFDAPNKLEIQLNNLKSQTQKLSVENYPVFLENAEKSRQIHKEFVSIFNLNGNLLTNINEVTTAVKKLLSTVDGYSQGFNSRSKSIQNYPQLLEFLELPQLMETCVQNGYYEDALNILAYTKQINKKHGHCVPLVKLVTSQAYQLSGQLFSQLCKQLREPISLPVCLKAVIFLRQLEVFSEQELRLNFLQARGVCLQNQLKIVLSKSSNASSDLETHLTAPEKGGFSASNKSEYKAYIRAMRRIEITRVQLFDTITQYRAVFTDDEITSWSSVSGDSKSAHTYGTGMSDINPLNVEDAISFTRSCSRLSQPICGLGPTNETSLFHAWLVYQVTCFLNDLVGDLKNVLHLPRLSAHEVKDHLSFIMSIVSRQPFTGDCISYFGDKGMPEAVTTSFHRIHSLLTRSLYFGQSFSRIGCDFRAHLASRFFNEISCYLETLLANAITEFTITLQIWPWELHEQNAANPVSDQLNIEVPKSKKDIESGVSIKPPIVLLRYPPLSMLLNRFLSTLNGLRICCPIGLKHRTMLVLLRALQEAAGYIVRAYRSQVESQLLNIKTKALHLADAFTTVLVPFLLTCIFDDLYGGDENAHLWHLHATSAMASSSKHLIYSLGICICETIFKTWKQLSPSNSCVDDYQTAASIVENQIDETSENKETGQVSDSYSTSENDQPVFLQNIPPESKIHIESHPNLALDETDDVIHSDDNSLILNEQFQTSLELLKASETCSILNSDLKDESFSYSSPTRNNQFSVDKNNARPESESDQSNDVLLDDQNNSCSKYDKRLPIDDGDEKILLDLIQGNDIAEIDNSYEVLQNTVTCNTDKSVIVNEKRTSTEFNVTSGTFTCTEQLKSSFEYKSVMNSIDLEKNGSSDQLNQQKTADVYNPEEMKNSFELELDGVNVRSLQSNSLGEFEFLDKLSDDYLNLPCAEEMNSSITVLDNSDYPVVENTTPSDKPKKNSGEIIGNMNQSVTASFTASQDYSVSETTTDHISSAKAVNELQFNHPKLQSDGLREFCDTVINNLTSHSVGLKDAVLPSQNLSFTDQVDLELNSEQKCVNEKIDSTQHSV